MTSRAACTLLLQHAKRLSGSAAAKTRASALASCSRVASGADASSWHMARRCLSTSSDPEQPLSALAKEESQQESSQKPEDAVESSTSQQSEPQQGELSMKALQDMVLEDEDDLTNRQVSMEGDDHDDHDSDEEEMENSSSSSYFSDVNSTNVLDLQLDDANAKDSSELSGVKPKGFLDLSFDEPATDTTSTSSPDWSSWLAMTKSTASPAEMPKKYQSSSTGTNAAQPKTPMKHQGSSSRDEVGRRKPRRTSFLSHRDPVVPLFGPNRERHLPQVLPSPDLNRRVRKSIRFTQDLDYEHAVSDLDYFARKKKQMRELRAEIDADQICGNCGEPGHIAEFCAFPLICHYCGSLDHHFNNCPHKEQVKADASKLLGDKMTKEERQQQERDDDHVLQQRQSTKAQKHQESHEVQPEEQEAKRLRDYWRFVDDEVEQHLKRSERRKKQRKQKQQQKGGNEQLAMVNETNKLNKDKAKRQ